MGLIWAGQKFRVELAADHKGMILYFNDFNEVSVRENTRRYKAGIFKFFAEGIVIFVAVAMSFLDQRLFIAGISLGPFS